jgi:hypothetical protein
MTTDGLREKVRIYLRDTGYGFSTSSRTYEDAEINAALTNAREKCFKALLGIPRMSRITAARMAKTATGTTGTSVPSDYVLLEAGTRSGASSFDPNGYIPAKSPDIGEALISQGLDAIFAHTRKFYGTAALAYYWAKPTSDLSLAATTLTDFSDSFYNGVAVLESTGVDRNFYQ